MKSPPSLSLADHRLLDLVWSSEPISSPQLCKLAPGTAGLEAHHHLHRHQAPVRQGLPEERGRRGHLPGGPGHCAAGGRAGGPAALLPRLSASFLAAFLRAGSVSDQEAAEIEQMLEEYRQSH